MLRDVLANTSALVCGPRLFDRPGGPMSTIRLRKPCLRSSRPCQRAIA